MTDRNEATEGVTQEPKRAEFPDSDAYWARAVLYDEARKSDNPEDVAARADRVFARLRTSVTQDDSEPRREIRNAIMFAIDVASGGQFNRDELADDATGVVFAIVRRVQPSAEVPHKHELHEFGEIVVCPLCGKAWKPETVDLLSLE